MTPGETTTRIATHRQIDCHKRLTRGAISPSVAGAKRPRPARHCVHGIRNLNCMRRTPESILFQMSWADSIPTPPDGCDETPFLSDRKPSWPMPSLLVAQPLFSAAPTLQLSESNQAKSERRCSKTYRFSLAQPPSTRREHVFFSRRAGPACEMKMLHNRTNQALFRLEPSSSSRAP